MLNLLTIDGVSYDVLITAIEEKFEVVEGANSGLALYRDREIRDLKGIKIGHSITFSPGADPEKFDELVDYLFGSLRDYVVVDVVHGQTTIGYQAAYNTASRRVAYINDKDDFVGWDDLTIDFRPMEARTES